MVDLEEHSIRDCSSFGPEVCGSVLLRRVAHDISRQQQISFPGSLETSKGEVDLLNELRHKLHLNVQLIQFLVSKNTSDLVSSDGSKRMCTGKTILTYRI